MITQNRFADLCTFLMVYNSFISGSFSIPDPEKVEAAATHEAEGHRLLAGFKDQIYEGIQQYLVQLEKLKVKGIRDISPHIRHYKKSISGPEDVLNKQDEVFDFLCFMLAWLGTRPFLREDLFNSQAGVVFSVLPRYANSKVGSFKEHANEIHEFVRLPSTSDLDDVRSWIQKAATLFEVQPSYFESMQFDVEKAQDLGSKIGKAQRNARKAKPNSSQLKEAREEVKNLERRVEKLASSSKNPEVVILASTQAANLQLQLYKEEKY